MVTYVSHYDDFTEIKRGETTGLQINQRSIGLRFYGLRCIGEKWIPGYGWTALWFGPELDIDEQNLLNLKKIEPKVT